MKQVRKRDGRIVPFEQDKIAEAIFKAAKAVGGEDRYLAEDLAESVTFYLKKQFADKIPTVEEIQDIVERVLIKTGHAKTAKAYILYREKRAHIRKIRKGVVSDDTPETPFLLICRSKDNVLLWERKKIIEDLTEGKGMSRNIAELIALEVEKQIFDSQVKSLTNSLIEEMVKNKLSEYSQKEGEE